MIRSSKNDTQQSLFFSLGDSLDQRHPLYLLAHQVDWTMFEKEFSKFYSSDCGAPAKPIRLMVGLLILKHVRNLSDENLVEQWSENIYYQYFVVKMNLSLNCRVLQQSWLCFANVLVSRDAN